MSLNWLIFLFLSLHLIRVDETEQIAKPQFFGTRGPEFEKICDKIEHNFFSSLQDIKDVQETILDVQASSWYDSIFRYDLFMGNFLNGGLPCYSP